MNGSRRPKGLSWISRGCRSQLKVACALLAISTAGVVPSQVAEGQLPGALAGGPSEAILSEGRVKVSVSWQSPYTGAAGAALPLLVGSEFAAFAFDAPREPEVFVRVLGSNDPKWIQLFAAGLTTYGFTVTFTGCGTKKTFEKKAFEKVTFEDAQGFPVVGCTPFTTAGSVLQRSLGGSGNDYLPRARGSQSIART